MSHPDLVLIFNIFMKSNPVLESIYDLHFFSNSHSKYLLSVITSPYTVEFIVNGGVCHSHAGFKSPTGINVCNFTLLISACLLFPLLQPYQSCMKLLITQTQHFLL